MNAPHSYARERFKDLSLKMISGLGFWTESRMKQYLQIMNLRATAKKGASLQKVLNSRTFRIAEDTEEAA